MEKINIFGKCPFCGNEWNIEVFEKDYIAWQNGELAQRAFPYLSADEREMLISGMCVKCQEKIFGGMQPHKIEKDF